MYVAKSQSTQWDLFQLLSSFLFGLRILNSLIYPHSKSYSAVFTAPHKNAESRKSQSEIYGPIVDQPASRSSCVAREKVLQLVGCEIVSLNIQQLPGKLYIYVLQVHFSLCLIKCFKKLFQKILLVCNQISLSTISYQICFELRIVSIQIRFDES